MTFDEYQQKAITTDTFAAKAVNVTDPAFVAKLLGLVGEAGEVAEKFKKIIRDKNGELSDLDRQDIKKELGDVLWYVSAVGHYLDIPLGEIANLNLDKVLSRQSRGVTKGTGDNR